MKEAWVLGTLRVLPCHQYSQNLEGLSLLKYPADTSPALPCPFPGISSPLPHSSCCWLQPCSPGVWCSMGQHPQCLLTCQGLPVFPVASFIFLLPTTPKHIVEGKNVAVLGAQRPLTSLIRKLCSSPLAGHLEVWCIKCQIAEIKNVNAGI